MRVMVIIKANADSEAGKMPETKLLEEMTTFNEELVKSGMMLAGDGLHPSVKGKRVRFDHGKKSVIDGPFAETKELISGFWIWQVRSMEEAVEWVKRVPSSVDEVSEIEIRPIFDSEDFGEMMTPELREREAKLAAAITEQNAAAAQKK